MSKTTLVLVLLTFTGLSSFASAYERELEEERRLGYKANKNPVKRLQKYLSINERCCEPDKTQCKCPVRNFQGWGGWFDYKSKWDTSCKPGGTIFKESSIVQIASTNEDFSTLASLLVEAGLVDDLMGEGPFTVFAPTNDAFVALKEANEAVFDAVLDEPEDLLVNVLKYHVLSAKVLSGDLTNDVKATMLNGKTTTFKVQGENFKIKEADVDGNDVNIVSADITASNGVIHVIDKVLVPPS